MDSSISSRWTTDPEYIDLLNFIIEKTKDAKSPIGVMKSAGDFKEKSGSSQAVKCLEHRIRRMRPIIHSFEHIDRTEKVKLLFALSASVDANFLKQMKEEAIVEVDDKKRITKYEAFDGSLELRGDHSLSAKTITGIHESKKSKRSHLSMIIDHFKGKNDSDAVPKNKEELEIWNLIEFITEKCENVDSPLSMRQLANDFNKKFGTSRARHSIRRRIQGYCRDIQKIESFDIHTKVKQLFYLSATLDSQYLKKLRKEALVEVDYKNRITMYSSNDNSLSLRGSHWGSKKTRRVEKTYKDNVAATADDSEEESDDEGLNDSSDVYSSEEFDSEFDSVEENDHPNETEDLMELSNDDFNNKTPVSNRTPTDMSVEDNFDFDPPTEKSHRSEEIEKKKDEEKKNDQEITGNAGIKTRSRRLSKRRNLDSDFSYNLVISRTSATPTSSDSTSSKPAKQKKTAIVKDQASNSSDRSRSSSRSIRRSSRKSSFPTVSTESEDHTEPSNEVDDFDNEALVRNRSPTVMSFDDNFDFDPPTERSRRSEENEMRGDDSEITGEAAIKTRKCETLPKSKTCSLTSQILKPSKTKTDASGSGSSKRTRSLSDKSMNPLQMDDNFWNEDPLRVDLKPFRGILGLPNRVEEHSDIEQIPKPRFQIMKAPIKEEHEEEARTSLKTILNAFKSLVLSLDTPGLSQFQMKIDKKLMETGRGVEVPNNEVILAMEFLIVKLSKHGTLGSSEDSISLRDILLMLRTIILNSGFNSLEVILEMLKNNIEQLKVLDKKVPVSKVECVLRATLDNILT